MSPVPVLRTNFPEGTVLEDRSHGSARAHGLLANPRNQCANRDQSASRGRRQASAFTAPDATVRVHPDRADNVGRWRNWIERAGAATPQQPVWSSRESWLTALSEWAQSPALAALCTAERVSITATTLLTIAAVMAEHADHSTGRHVAITRATIAARAGCGERTVTAAWRLLRASGWAVEAQRGHGSPGTPSVGQRPSVYHLVPRRQPPSAPATPERAELRGIEPLNSPPAESTGISSTSVPVDNSTNCHLPPLGGVCFLSPVGNNSPSAQPHAENSSPTRTSRRWRAEPRPLPVQRLAAELVTRCHGLHRTHIGAICDAITTAGIDPATWSAPAITTKLNTDMKARGWSWPNQIERPGAFLASRLRRIDWSTPTAPAAVGDDMVGTAPCHPVAINSIKTVPATAAQRAAARAYFAEHKHHRLAHRLHPTTTARDAGEPLCPSTG